MPYLHENHRRDLLENLDAWPLDAADLNFLICRLADRMLARRGVTYARLNEVIGAIECAKQEIYRRIAAPYEDTKLKENGDVFTTVPGQWTGGPTASP